MDTLILVLCSYVFGSYDPFSWHSFGFTRLYDIPKVLLYYVLHTPEIHNDVSVVIKQ